MPIRYSSVVGGSSSTGFNLDVGSSGNTTFTFSEAQPAGGYSITSQLTDATIEFYAIAEDGTLAGYTNTKALTATQDFNTIVIYGASNNDLITFEFKPTTLPSGNGDQDSGAAPFIASVSDSDLGNLDDATIITGGNFATDVIVTFTGTDSVVRNAKSIVRTNSTQLIVTRPDDFLEDNSPYTIEISNPNIPQSAYKTYTSSVTAGGDPVWSTTAGALPLAALGNAYSQTIQATDPDGGAIQYQIVSGSLPSGLSLNSNTGEISGTNTSSGAFSFVVSAIDPNGNTTNRSFKILDQLATGGAVTDIDGYRYHTFTSSGTLTVAAASEIEVTLIGAGGGGGAGYTAWAASGGGGGYLVANYDVSEGPYSVVVGAKGPGQTVCNNSDHTDLGKGGSSTFGNLIASGGWGGSFVDVNNAYASLGGTNVTTGATSIIKNYSGGNGNRASSQQSGQAGGSNGLHASEGDSTYGTGAAAVPNGQPGNHATGNGNGGGGGPSCQSGHRGGGDGSDGLVIIRYPI